jgi:hypothetical protein
MHRVSSFVTEVRDHVPHYVALHACVYGSRLRLPFAPSISLLVRRGSSSILSPLQAAPRDLILCSRAVSTTVEPLD